ncbi:hypothetical protein BDN72DRAFT_832421 [Pluteus cervinus]|uniref:Uncharacterized protein n=1 Tax=Pluteus cervinus TaxID=181527 RepID=A0ACD3BBA6_9AGAR|nr:hypothetical protein BDN72DRAFT_832421 [Pluteus cervinus]
MRRSLFWFNSAVPFDRHLYIHLLWEEIILCSLHGGQRNTTTNPAWIRHACGLDLSSYCAPCERYLASEIVSQLETVTVRVPEFATRVQTLSIFLPKYSAKTIVPEFARCLALLPNLTTLQFHYNSSGYALDDDLQRVFSQYQYPNIQTLVIPCNIRSLRVLKACPKVRHLHFTSIERDYSGMDVCPSVEKFTGEAPEAPQPSRPVPEFLRQLPNLKYLQMKLGASGPSSYYINPLYRAETLSPLRHLEVVEIAIMHPKARKEAEALLASVDSVLARMPTMSGIHRRVELTDYTTQLD